MSITKKIPYCKMKLDGSDTCRIQVRGQKKRQICRHHLWVCNDAEPEDERYMNG